jgi:hypothetical protein
VIPTPYLRLGSFTATLDRVRTCAVKNRMRELRSFGSVRGEGSNVLTYSENRPTAAVHDLQLLSASYVTLPSITTPLE